MKKIRLELDRLEVTSFETHEVPGVRGTVRGNNNVTKDGSYTCFYHCTWNHVTCEGEATCACQPNTGACSENLTCAC